MTNRRLTAVLAADIAGYSALMGVDDERTVRDLKAHQSAVFPLIAQHGGRIIDTAGDGILAEFPSAVEAVKAAIAIQRTVAERNQPIEADRRLEFRIGVNLGDVLFDEGRIYGDGVNIAARLEGIATPGGICVSRSVFEQVANKVDAPFVDMGEKSVKNIPTPVHVFALSVGGDAGARAGVAAARRATPPAAKTEVLGASVRNWAVVGGIVAAVAVGGGLAATLLRPAPTPTPVPVAQSATPGPSATAMAFVGPRPPEHRAFDGLWEVQQSGNEFCARKEVKYWLRVTGGVITLNERERGFVSLDASLRWQVPSPTNPNFLVNYTGKLADGQGDMTYVVPGSKCTGVATLKRVAQ